ncbi:MAG: hypothetical protein Q9164_003985 [Protoblastenia rupestris]
MADPLSVLGAAVGVTALIIQVTDECIKGSSRTLPNLRDSILAGFKFYQEAANFPETHRYLSLRLQIEQQRFVNFSLELGTLDSEDIGRMEFQVNRSLLVAVLAEVKTLLQNFAEKNGKYENLMSLNSVPWKDGPKLEVNLQSLGMISESEGTLPGVNSRPHSNAVATSRVHGLAVAMAQRGKKLRKIVLEPKRLVWAAVDKDSFANLIAKLEDLNTFLISFLDKSQLHRLQDTIEASYMETLQVRNELVSLTTLVKALELRLSNPLNSLLRTADPYNHSLSQTVAEETASQKKRNNYLKQLTEIKIQCTLSNQPDDIRLVTSLPRPEINPLPLDEFVFAEKAPDYGTFRRRLSGSYRQRRIWIEWTDLYMQSEHLERRISLLADLLSLVKPDGFRAPPCLGYVKALHKGAADRFGMVFESPSNGTPVEIVVLRDLLGQTSVPSLSARISLCAVLARSVHSFHAVNWLHKGLRADSVVFPSSSELPDLTAPFVSGFELSRPSIIHEMTEKPEFNPWHDVYRHPKSQSSQSDGTYRKSYDIYSFGVVLLEICLWKRVEDLVGLNLPNTKPTSLLQVRSQLLENSVLPPNAAQSEPYLHQVACACGGALSYAIRLCLEAVDIEETEWLGEHETSIAIRLQNRFEQDVVKRLERIAEIL